jgi:hypothetical protein
MTPLWQGALLVVFTIGGFFAWRGGLAVVRQVFAKTHVAACAALAVAQTLYVIEAHQISAMTQIAIGMLAVALGLEAIDRRKDRRGGPASTSPATE